MEGRSTAMKMLDTLREAITRVDAFVKQESKLQTALDYPLRWERVTAKDAEHLVGGKKITFGRSEGPQANQPGSFYMKDEKHLYEVRTQPMGGYDWKSMEYLRTPMNQYVEQVLQANIDLHKIGPKTILSLSRATKEVQLPQSEPLDTFVKRGQKLDDHLASSRNKIWEPVTSEAARHLSAKERLLYNEGNISANVQKETWYKKDNSHLYKFGRETEDEITQSNIKIERTPLSGEVQHILNSNIAHHKDGPKLMETLTQRQGQRL